MIKNLFKILIFTSLGTNAFALEIYNDDTNKMDLGGRFSFYSTSSHNKAQDTKTYADMSDFGSRINLMFTNTDIEALTVSAKTEWGINTQERRNKDVAFLTNRESYIDLATENMGHITVGKVWSIVNSNTVSHTDRARNTSLDSGYTAQFKDGDGSDFSNGRLKSSMAYQYELEGFSFGLQGQGKDHKLRVRQNLDRNLVADSTGKTSVVGRDFSIGGYVRYKNDMLSAGLGYTRVKNTILDSTATQLTNSKVSVNNFVGGAGLTLNKLYLGVSAGYYQNLITADSKYIGTSAIVTYALDKVKVHAGWKYLYAPDVTKSLVVTPGVDRPKKSVESHEAVIGMVYSASSKLVFIAEYVQDLRTHGERATSVYDTRDKNSNAVTLAVTYYI